MKIETLYYQAFIPSENRGGEYHVTLRDDAGKISGPFTPAQADKLGFKLSDIFADIDTQLALAVIVARDELEKAKAENDGAMAQAKRIEETAALAVAGANEVIAKIASHVTDEGREILAAEIGKLNKRLISSVDPIKVADVGAGNEIR